MIRKFLLDQKCKSLSKGKGKMHTSYAGSRHIGILFNAAEFDMDVIQAAMESFGTDGKEVSILGMVEEETEEHNRFSTKDISSIGVLKKEAISLFSNKPFDFLLSLDTSADINFKYLLALSKASCKIGFDNEAYYSLLQMAINPGNNPKMSVKTLIKYLKMIE